MDEQADRRAREHQQMDTWKYYDALSLSLSLLWPWFFLKL
jgi:hypothetical protein